jgi:hypothetical protein
MENYKESTAQDFVNAARKAAWEGDFKLAVAYLAAAEKLPLRPGQVAAIARLRGEWAAK